MARALTLAAQARGKTSPNPMVGAVLVKNGRVLGEGYHRRAGADHAEIVALKAAGKKAHGATLYVTLEPCCHTGRTGPCTDALMEAGVSRVYYATVDPNPHVAGGGARKLRAAGIEVHGGLLRDEARCLNEDYFTFHATGRPFVILKIAQTLDGRVATRSGHSQWITGLAARTEGHRLRAAVDAVLTGGETVRRDNPALTVRHVTGDNPYRLVLSSTLRFPKQCRLIRKNQDHKTVLVSTARIVEAFSNSKHAAKLTYWTVRSGGRGKLDLAEVLRQAAGFGIQSILIEAGPSLATAFLTKGLVDRVVCFVAPRILGKGIDAVGDLALDKVTEALHLNETVITPLGKDIMISGWLKRGWK
jgi:diaminohydroxyphosphoribosylaminopyrimidine deaminase/5-amino-6-(5-phosphoribosylamino)uracil reductase